MEKIRAFIAIALPENIKDSLTGIQNKLRECGTGVKWVYSGNIHLTLKFLGEISQEKLDTAFKITEEIAQDKFRLKIKICSLGVFPDIKQPKIIWAGIEEGNKEIGEIVYELEEKLKKLGILKEKREFSSHITLGRVKSLCNKDTFTNTLDILKKEFPKDSFEFTADKIIFYKSTLTPGGPIYETLKEVTLKAT